MRFTLLLVFVLIFTFTHAQKRRKKGDSHTELNEIEISDEDSLKVEMTLIEAQKEFILDRYDKAYELFLVVNKLNSKMPSVNFKIAEILSKQGKNADALVYAQTAIDLDASNKYYYLLTAELHKALSNFDLAAKTYESMFENVKDVDTYLFDLAVIYRYTGRFEEAIAVYNRVEDSFGPSELLFRAKEEIFKQTQNYSAIVSELRKLITAKPDEIKYKIELIELLYGQNRLDDVEKELKVLDSNVEGQVAVAMIRSRIALSNGEIDRSISLAEIPISSDRVELNDKLLLINDILTNKNVRQGIEPLSVLCINMAEQYPDQYVVHAYAGDVLFQLEKPKQAREYYLKAVELDASHFEVWQNILNIDGSLNDTEGMIQHAETALEYFPNQALLYYFSGTGHLIQNNNKRAVQVLEQGEKFALDPQLLTIIYGQLGDAYHSMKDYDKSSASYDKALQQNPLNDHVLNNYSYFLSLRETSLDKANEMSAKLVNKYPENATYLDTHGWVLYKLGKYSEAEPILKKAVEIGNDGTITEHYGDVLYKLGKIDEALIQWQKAIELGGVSEDLPKKIAEKRLYE